MELDEIKEYSHKIKKIHINNQNKVSQFDTVTIKIGIDDKKDNEIIRFSADEYSNWLTHQSSDNDYFLEIPNVMNTVMTIYAHYFPTALYDYLEDQNIFSIYQWTELMDDIPISQYHNESYLINDGEAYIDENTYLKDNNILVYNGVEYTIGANGVVVDGNKYDIRDNKLIVNGYSYYKNIKSQGYNYVLDDENKLVVRSLLNDSINKFQDPNYKNYSKLIDDNTVSNETEQGFFPLSSRYRGYKYLTAPNINKNPLPYWQHSSQSARNCTRENDSPYWQTKIHKSGLSPLIGEDQDNQYIPINVYLNYQYLPTSTEYHQHYYGFEPKNNHQGNVNGMYENLPNDTYEVLEGENITTVNQGFGNEKATYRLINHGNPFDDNHTIEMQHGKEISINLSQGIVNNCTWERNICEKDNEFWMYTPNGQGDVSINVELEEGEPYKLQYFLYIPSDSIVEYNSCTVSVEHRSEFGTITKVKELDEAFLEQDKFLRDQWIYHELDFIAEQNNRICIRGPQHTKKDKQIEVEKGHFHNKTAFELTLDDKVYFVNFKLIKMEEYSPTIKYTETGLYLVEGAKWTNKPTKEQIKSPYTDCVETPTATNVWKKKNKLPTPIKDVYFRFENDFDIVYNDITTELIWTTGLDDVPFSFLPYNEYLDEELKWQTDGNEVSLIYDELNDGELKLWRKRGKTFTTGINNSFSLILQDSSGNKITTGEVECAIVKSRGDKDTPCNQTIMCLGKKNPDDYGRVFYSKLNFKKLKPSNSENTYFLRVTYTNPCYKKTIVGFKRLFFEKEHRNMSAYINKCSSQKCKKDNTDTCCKLTAKSEYDSTNDNYILQQETPYKVTSVDELPLHIDVNIYNQLGQKIEDGYCELSVNDKVIQSTLIDEEGIADFYIDFNDLYGNEKPSNNYNYIKQHTIKIEYFTKFFETINFLYFDIQYDGEYDTREAIPIDTYAISDDTLLKTNEFHISKSNIFMLNIDTEDATNFSITIEKGNEKYSKDIISPNNPLILTAEYNNVDEEVYTITTGNISTNTDNGPYRKTKKSFKIIWE
ncbi:MAG: hypothetical protein J6A15_00925 [Clostridia bacterium]|nr:hypothetical protein [Clostridia bacterium]